MADCFDAMSIGIQHKRAIIIGVIVRPEPRRAIVASPTRKRRRVKGIDRRAIGSAKADMCTGNGRPHFGFTGDGEFDSGRPRCGTMIGTTVLAEINDEYEPERTQCCVVETPTAAAQERREKATASRAPEAEEIASRVDVCFTPKAP
jgi:hypothetical protein